MTKMKKLLVVLGSMTPLVAPIAAISCYEPKQKQEEPKKEDPKKEDPKKEDPKKEDPKKEDPKKEDPKKEDPKDKNLSKEDVLKTFNEKIEKVLKLEESEIKKALNIDKTKTFNELFENIEKFKNDFISKLNLTDVISLENVKVILSNDKSKITILITVEAKFNKEVIAKKEKVITISDFKAEKEIKREDVLKDFNEKVEKVLKLEESEIKKALNIDKTKTFNELFENIEKFKNDFISKLNLTDVISLENVKVILSNDKSKITILITVEAKFNKEVIAKKEKVITISDFKQNSEK